MNLANNEFGLHPQLAADCHLVCDLPLCRVLLMDNRLFPWLILVPRIAGAVELTSLEGDVYQAVMAEIKQVANIMQREFSPDKMNIAALGNMVPQLHIHMIARYRTDIAWPQPVWGKDCEPYDAEAAKAVVVRLYQKMRGLGSAGNERDGT